MHYARHLEKVRQEPSIDLLRDAENVVFRRPKQWRKSKPTAFLGLAIEWGLNEYVRVRITEDPGLLRARSRPLLEYALGPMVKGVRYRESARLNQGWDDEVAIRPDIVELLLSHNAPIEPRVWRPVLVTVFEYNEGIPSRSRLDRKAVVATLALLVKYEAILQEKVIVTHKVLSKRNDYGAAAAQGHLDYDNILKAIDILGGSFTPEELETILRHEPSKTSQSWWSQGPRQLWLSVRTAAPYH